MTAMLDSFWRAAAYCLHPRVIFLSLLPLLVSAGCVFALGWFFWEGAVDALRATLDQWQIVQLLKTWLRSVGAGSFVGVLEPLILVALAVPVIVVLSLLAVAWMLTPAVVRLVVARRFENLAIVGEGSWWRPALWSLWCTCLALLALVASIPLWFVPPLVLVLPPLIWGWLTFKVLSFEVLSAHASVEERRLVMQQHRWPMLAMGVVCGYLGAAPSLVWAVGAFAVVLAPMLVVFSVWLYTLIFAFSSLWFAHYALAALQDLRARPLHEATLAANPIVVQALPPT